MEKDVKTKSVIRTKIQKIKRYNCAKCLNTKEAEQ